MPVALFAIFEPQGIVAHEERSLIITMVLLMFLFVGPMLLILYFSAWRNRAAKSEAAAQTPEARHSPWRELLWWIVPTVFIIIISGITWVSAHKIDPMKPIAAGPGVKPLTVQVVALNWKWLFIYPEQGIATVNFVEFPAGTPLEFQLTADDAPMNSFWIPQLGGQMYAMGGMVNRLHLMADAPGEFQGSAAEISGEGFAGMRFVAKAVTQADFDAWAASVKNSALPLTAEGYAALVAPSKDEPQAFYSSVPKDLYNTIIMKTMAPAAQAMPMQ